MRSQNAQIPEIISRYEQVYDGYCPDLSTVQDADWNQERVDGAYFCTLYADSIGMDSTAERISTDLLTAKDSGVKVTKNSANLSVEDLKAIQAKNSSTIKATFEDLGEAQSE